MKRINFTNVAIKLSRIDKRWIAALVLIGLAEAWRLYNYQHMIAPGFEIVTASTLVAAALLPRRAAIVVPLALMVGGDLIIGNSPILLFTWSAFAAIGLAGLALRRFAKRPGRLALTSIAAGVGSALFFFLYSNFGVWLLSDGTMYAKSWSGLVECYIMGLPFYRMNLIGNLIFVPMFMAAGVYGSALFARARQTMTAAPHTS